MPFGGMQSVMSLYKMKRRDPMLPWGTPEVTAGVKLDVLLSMVTH